MRRQRWWWGAREGGAHDVTMSKVVPVEVVLGAVCKRLILWGKVVEEEADCV